MPLLYSKTVTYVLGHSVTYLTGLYSPRRPVQAALGFALSAANPRRTAVGADIIRPRGIIFRLQD